MFKNFSKSRFARFRVLGSWDKKSLEKFSSSNFELTNSLQLVTKFTTYFYLQNLQRNLHNHNNNNNSLKLHFIWARLSYEASIQAEGVEKASHRGYKEGGRDVGEEKNFSTYLETLILVLINLNEGACQKSQEELVFLGAQLNTQVPNFPRSEKSRQSLNNEHIRTLWCGILSKLSHSNGKFVVLFYGVIMSCYCFWCRGLAMDTNFCCPWMEYSSKVRFHLCYHLQEGTQCVVCRVVCMQACARHKKSTQSCQEEAGRYFVCHHCILGGCKAGALPLHNCTSWAFVAEYKSLKKLRV